MQVNQPIFNQGVTLGTIRARHGFQDNTLDLNSESKARIYNALDWWPRDLTDRFVELFVEVATVASIAREKNDEPKLTEAEVVAYLAHSVSFNNSFTHP